MKVVHYDGNKGIQVMPGGGAMVYPLDHTSPHVTNTKVAFTSKVQAHDEKSGVFVTLNSLYIPVKF